MPVQVSWQSSDRRGTKRSEERAAPSLGKHEISSKTGEKKPQLVQHGCDDHSRLTAHSERQVIRHEISNVQTVKHFIKFKTYFFYILKVESIKYGHSGKLALRIKVKLLVSFTG